MADTKISAFTERTTIAGTEEFVIAVGGTNYKFKMSTLFGSDLGRAIYPDDVSVETGDGVFGILIPVRLNGFNITDVIAGVHTKGVTGSTNIQVRRRRAGSDVDMLSTLVTIGDEYYARDGVIDTDNDDLATGDMLYFDIDAIHSGTAPLGLSCMITVGLP